MSLPALSALLSSLVALAIGVSALLGERWRRTVTAFATLTLSLATFNILAALEILTGSRVAGWLALFPAVFLPAAATRFFRSFLSEPAIGGHPPPPRVTYVWTGAAVLALLYGQIFRPIHETLTFRLILGLYVFASLYLAVGDVWAVYRATLPRAAKARLRYLFIGGFVAVTTALTDRLGRFGLDFPAVGNVIALLYLYLLSQSISQRRILDLAELAAKLVVLGSLVAILLAVYGILLVWIGGQGIFLLHTFAASFVVLVLFEPVRSLIETRVHRWLARERHELRHQVEGLRRELTGVFETAEMARRILAALERSGRLTAASLFILDEDGAACDLAGSFGRPPTARRLALGAHRPLFDRLRQGPVSLDVLAAEQARLEDEGARPAEALEGAGRSLADLGAALAVPILDAAGEPLGVLAVRDERSRDPFTDDELEQFAILAAGAATTIESSRAYARLKERDRLAALGEMAAGLAHEIRNPLGAIKGAAQLLLPEKGSADQRDVAEFLPVIVDEVNRLNRVVGQFLDYARPLKPASDEVDLAEVLRRTAQLLEQSERARGKGIVVYIADDTPRVRGDAEKLRQVFLNLGLNSLEALEAGGTVTLQSLRRAGRRVGEAAVVAEVRVSDNGPGIRPEHLRRLFIPFFTTKPGGSGLGLPVSQRIVNHHGGTIEARSDNGAVFTVVLPAFE